METVSDAARLWLTNEQSQSGLLTPKTKIQVPTPVQPPAHDTADSPVTPVTDVTRVSGRDARVRTWGRYAPVGMRRSNQGRGRDVTRDLPPLSPSTWHVFGKHLPPSCGCWESGGRRTADGGRRTADGGRRAAGGGRDRGAAVHTWAPLPPGRGRKREGPTGGSREAEGGRKSSGLR